MADTDQAFFSHDLLQKSKYKVVKMSPQSRVSVGRTENVSISQTLEDTEIDTHTLDTLESVFLVLT